MARTASDSELLRSAACDGASFEELVGRHGRAIYAFVAARVGPDSAEDVTSETFATAYRRRSTFDPAATSARPWLYGIAVNKLRQHRDAERRWLEQPTSENLTGTAEADDTAARVDAHALIPELAMALALLSPGERDVLLLHVFAELSHAQIAQVLGIRQTTAKVRLHRGRARLRVVLQVHVEQGDER